MLIIGMMSNLKIFIHFKGLKFFTVLLLKQRRLSVKMLLTGKGPSVNIFIKEMNITKEVQDSYHENYKTLKTREQISGFQARDWSGVWGL